MIDDKPLISYVENENIYFNIDMVLDYTQEYNLKITSRTDFFDISNILLHDFNSEDTFTMLPPEDIIKDIHISRKFNLKTYNSNCFTTDNSFSFIYKRLQYDNSTEQLEEQDINIFNHFNVSIHAISYNNIETNLKITNDMITVVGNIYTISNFNHNKYQIINIILNMKPKITININSDENQVINQDYDNIELHTFIPKSTMLEKYINYLLLFTIILMRSKK